MPTISSISGNYSLGLDLLNNTLTATSSSGTGSGSGETFAYSLMLSSLAGGSDTGSTQLGLYKSLGSLGLYQQLNPTALQYLNTLTANTAASSASSLAGSISSLLDALVSDSGSGNSILTLASNYNLFKTMSYTSMQYLQNLPSSGSASPATAGSALDVSV